MMRTDETCVSHHDVTPRRLEACRQTSWPGRPASTSSASTPPETTRSQRQRTAPTRYTVASPAVHSACVCGSRADCVNAARRPLPRRRKDVHAFVRVKTKEQNYHFNFLSTESILPPLSSSLPPLSSVRLLSHVPLHVRPALERARPPRPLLPCPARSRRDETRRLVALHMHMHHQPPEDNTNE